MLNKAKNLARKILPAPNDLTVDDVREAREYIAEYWTHLERYHPSDEKSLIGLPEPYIVPSYAEGHEFDYNELFYWDSFFMMQGLLDAQHKKLLMGILEDFIFLFNRFHVIPNASRTYQTSRSQPPFLTSFIFDLYDTYKLDIKWLERVIETAKDEYFTVWMGTRTPHARRVYRELSRYYDFT